MNRHDRNCSVNGCERPVHQRELCVMHYGRQRSNGSPEKLLRVKYDSPEHELIANRRITERGCWEWTRKSVSRKGYGLATTHEDFGSRQVHRRAFKLWVGEIPQGLMVLHKCDNRLCFNPDHLYAGTAQQNTNDMLSREREQRGESRWNAKLTESAVREIHENCLGLNAVKFAKILGVSPRTVRDVINGITWKHVPRS